MLRLKKEREIKLTDGCVVYVSGLTTPKMARLASLLMNLMGNPDEVEKRVQEEFDLLSSVVQGWKCTAGALREFGIQLESEFGSVVPESEEVPFSKELFMDCLMYSFPFATRFLNAIAEVYTTVRERAEALEKNLKN